jgi:hypothetical protein
MSELGEPRARHSPKEGAFPRVTSEVYKRRSESILELHASRGATLQRYVCSVALLMLISFRCAYGKGYGQKVLILLKLPGNISSLIGTCSLANSSPSSSPSAPPYQMKGKPRCSVRFPMPTWRRGFLAVSWHLRRSVLLGALLLRRQEPAFVP